MQGMQSNNLFSVIIFTYISLAQICSAVDIQVAFMAPSSSPHGYNASSTFPALAYALDKLANDSIIPDGYNLVVTWYDTACESSVAAGTAVELYINNTVDVFIGPPCPDSTRVVSDLAAYWNKPVVSWVPLPLALTDKTTYNTLLGSFGAIYFFAGRSVASLFERAGWERCATIYNNVEYNDFMHSAVVEQLIADNVKITTSFEMTADASSSEIKDVFQEIKHEARIIVLIVPSSEIRAYMLKAYELNMVDGEYAFLWVQDTVTEEFLFGGKPWQANDGEDDEARKAYKALLHAVIANDIAYDESYYTAWRTDALDIATRAPYTEIFSDAVQTDLYSPYLVYGMYMYAYALNDTITSGGDYTSGTQIFSHAQLLRFASPFADYTPRFDTVACGPWADRVSGAWLLDQRNDNRFKIIEDAYPYFDGVGNIGFETQIISDVRWPDGSKGWSNAPPDTPKCDFDGSKCMKELNLLVILLPMFLLLFAFGIAVMLLVYFLRMKSFKRQVAMLLWEIKYKDIDFETKTMGSQTKLKFTERIQANQLANQVVGSKSTLNSSAEGDTLEDTVQSGHRTTKVATYRGHVVAVKFLRKEDLAVTEALTIDLGDIKKISHRNLNVFVGACIERFCICALWRYCSKGSLYDLINDENVKLDSFFKISIIADILAGMQYLHESAIGSHGRLKSTNVVVDSRWTCKITDYGVNTLYDGEGDDPNSSAEEIASGLLWTAPELLRNAECGRQGTREGDVYSFAIIAKELMCRNTPYEEMGEMSPTEILDKVRYPELNQGVIFRPSLFNMEAVDHRKQILHLMHISWNEDPAKRPTFSRLHHVIKTFNRKASTNLMESMLNMVERYANNLEGLVAERTKLLQAEKKRTDQLLHRMLPKSVAAELREGRAVEPEWFDEATIYFSDVVGFTSLAKDSSPFQIVAFLNALYNTFDNIIENYDVYKVETIGDAYMIVSGVPKRNGHRHAAEIAHCALDLLKQSKTFQIPHVPNKLLQIRIGCHTGACAAGVVGNVMPRYCLFGDTVNTASRMESNGEPMKIHVSEQCKKALETFQTFVCSPRGTIDVKGKGHMYTFWLVGTKEPVQSNTGVESTDTTPSEKETVTTVTETIEPEVPTAWS